MCFCHTRVSYAKYITRHGEVIKERLYWSEEFFCLRSSKVLEYQQALRDACAIVDHAIIIVRGMLETFMISLILLRCKQQASLLRAIGGRRHMEDYFAVKLEPFKETDEQVVGIFDGHGGKEAAKYAREALYITNLAAQF